MNIEVCLDCPLAEAGNIGLAIEWMLDSRSSVSDDIYECYFRTLGSTDKDFALGCLSKVNRGACIGVGVDLKDKLNKEVDRADPAYVREVLAKAFGVNNSALILGVKSDGLPETFEELKSIVTRSKNPNCETSNEIDKYMELIAGDPDPDLVARSLPFDAEAGCLIFLLPNNVQEI